MPTHESSLYTEVPLCSTVIGGGAPSSFLDVTEGNSGQVVGGSEQEIGPGETRPVQRAKMMAWGRGRGRERSKNE
jgi:hypothetical protein